MNHVRDAAEQALLPLPLAEAVDPEIFTAYGSLLLSRPTLIKPVAQYALHCNTLDFAITTRSTEHADEAFAGLTGLTEHPDFDLALRPFTYVRMALAYEKAMRLRVARQSVSRDVRREVYHNMTRVMSDVMAHPEMDEDRKSGYMGEALILSALLRLKKAKFPFFSLAREENSACHAKANHDFYVIDNAIGKQPWQIKMNIGTDLATIEPVRDIYVLPVLDEALGHNPEMKKQANQGKASKRIRRQAQRGFLANLMIREANEDELSVSEASLLADFSGIAARRVNEQRSFTSETSILSQTTPETSLADAFRAAGWKSD